MGNFLESAGLFLSHFPHLAYLFLALAILIQAETTILFAIYLIINGHLHWGVFLVISLVVLVFAECGFFFSGRYLRETRLGFWLVNRLPYHNRLQDYLLANTFQFIIFSKFIFGLNTPAIFFAGWSQLPFRRFIRAHLAGFLIWFFLVCFFGYFLVLGLDYLKTAHVFKQIEIGMLFLVAAFIGCQYFLKRFLIKTGKWETAAQRWRKRLSHWTDPNGDDNGADNQN